MRRVIPFGLGLLIFAGCAGTAVNGTVAGNSIGAQDAIATQSGSSLPINVMISSAGNLCADTQASEAVGNSSGLTIFLGHTAGGVFENGTYNIVTDVAQLLQSNQLLAVAQASRLTSSCKNSLDASASVATSGTVTVTHIDLTAGGSVQGSFDLYVGSQKDHLTGSFNAAFCDLGGKSPTTNVCQ